jgi:hypothetical protein
MPPPTKPLGKAGPFKTISPVPVTVKLVGVVPALKVVAEVVVKVIVTHANMKVELEDDFGGVVEHRRAELVCPE